MARKNRLVVQDGLYHVTARVAHQERLLRNPAFKSQIVDWIYDIADFSGVEVCAWNVMDNHLHLFLHVPPVPEKYWLNPPSDTTLPEGTVPDSTTGTVPSAAVIPPCSPAFSMRPGENRAPRWSPDLSDRNHPITPAGDCPSEEAIVAALSNGLPVACVPHPPTGFTMSDEEMIGRLRYLYRPDVVDKIAERWAAARQTGRGDSVEEEKDAYCRRMYNVSQYMKTLKQRISQTYNRDYKHEGQLWDGRFHSALVDSDDVLARLYVTSYIDLNSYRTKKKIAPKAWRWCSYSTAIGDTPLAERARKGYELMFGVSWEEVIRRLESVFEAELPADYDAEKGDTSRLTSMAQLVKISCRMLERGGFVSRSMAFAERTLAAFSPKFPAPGTRSVSFFGRLRWEMAA